MKFFIRNYHQHKGIIIFCILGGIAAFFIGNIIPYQYLSGLLNNISASFFYAIITLIIINTYLVKKKHEAFDAVNSLISK